MIRYDSAASYDHGTGPAPRAWRVARDLQIPVRELTGMELAAAVLDSLMLRAGLAWHCECGWHNSEGHLCCEDCGQAQPKR